MIPQPKYGFLPFRDQVYRIQFEDGREPAYVSQYNGEITGWSDNAPDALKKYSWPIWGFMERLTATGMAFFNEGPNEYIPEC